MHRISNVKWGQLNHGDQQWPPFFIQEFQKGSLKNKNYLFGKISPNGFGISEVAEGVSKRSGERPKGHFAYSELCEVASDSKRVSITRKNSEAIMPKRSERPEPTAGRRGGASDFGITYRRI